MTWTTKYWDIVSHFYWIPSYLGLASIPRKKWTVEGDAVKIPKAMTNPNGPLYRRTKSGDDYWAYIKRQEETINHIFDLTVAIMPGDVISRLFSPFIGAHGLHDYQFSSGSMRDMYPWISGENVTTPDAFFLAKDSILAVELKFRARISLDQLAKYVALIVGEEMLNGKRSYLDLLYIMPSDPDKKFERQTTILPSSFCANHYDLLCGSTRNARVKALFIAERDAVKSALSRMTVSCVTWRAFKDQLILYCNALSQSPGDRTLGRLIGGLVSEIHGHPHSRAGQSL